MRLGISLPGNDVKKASLVEEVLDSRYPSPKIDAFATPPHAGTITINQTQTGYVLPSRGIERVLYSFPHGYDYVPAVLGMYTFNNTNEPDLIYSGSLPEVFVYVGGGLFVIDIFSDLNNVYITILGLADLPPTTNPFIFKIRFYVLAERGHE